MQTYLLDVERNIASALPEFGLSELTERHFVGELERHSALLARTAEDALQNPDGDVVLTVRTGLPSLDILGHARNALENNRNAYFYWPYEGVVEVADGERIRSLRLHHRVVNLYWRWRRARQGQTKKRSEKTSLRNALKQPRLRLTDAKPDAVAEVREPLSKFDFLKKHDGAWQAEGRGLYIRLDYWARITGGGSYGHTCYQAKSLAKSSTDDLYAVMASPFQLLDELSIPQIVLPSQTPDANEFALVENGEAYRTLVDAMLDTYRPAYVFERLVLGNASVARACAERNIPYIAEFNGSELTMSKIFGGREMQNADVLQAIETENFQKADIISVVSEPVKDEVVALGISADKIIINPNGVDPDAYSPLPDPERAALKAELGVEADDVVVGFCGTFGGWHGIEVLAEAMPRIVAERPNAKFLLIGAGNFKHYVTDAIEQAGMSDRVIDAGLVPQQEAARLLSACDIFLSPHSKNMGDRPFFGSPTKLFEYMAYDAGIVCSDLVQLGEVMRPALTLGDKDGDRRDDARSVLVAPASVDELVDATVWLIDEPDLRTELGNNARQAALDYYTWDVHVQSLWSFAKGEELGGYNFDRHQQ